MSPEVLEHPFWWRVFERPDARFALRDVAEVLLVKVHETANESTTPDIDATVVLTLRNWRGATIRAHYDHTAQRITAMKWSVTRPEFPSAAAA